ncbi:MAG TPA: hypothetical protein PKW90_29120, partial [Myxococcota bacterium]|nr:hypothetical protein [Myxococcota bacterium]
MIRRLVSPVAPSTPGALLHLPIAFKGAGFAGSATLHVVLRYEGGAGVADVEHDGTTVAGSTFQGLVDVPDTIQLSADTRPGWYAVLVSMVRGGQGIACIPARGVTEVQTHVYQVGEVLVHNALDRDGLSLWTFDEPAGSTVFADALNVRWPLMFTTTTTPTPGVSTPYGRGLRFSGTNVTPQTLTVPREMVPGPQFTAGFWFSLQRTSMLASILVSGVYAQDGFRMGLVPRGTNLLVGAWATQSGGTFELLSTNGIRTNEWHHLAFAFDGTLGVLYLDGRRAATPTRGTTSRRPWR